MNLLLIANDPQVFNEASEVRSQLRTYASAVGNLHVLSRSKGSMNVSHEGPLMLHPYKGSRLAMSRAARAIIQEYDIQVVSAEDPFEYGLIAFKAVEGTKVKLHIQVHTDFLSPWFIKGGGFRSPRVRVPFLNHWRRQLADKVLPAAHGIRTVSKRVRDSLMAYYETAIVSPSVIPIPVGNVVPPAIALPEHGFSFALITASGLEPEKRIEDVLYALARIRFDYPAVGLFIVGTGSEEGSLKRLVRKLGLTSRVIFINEERADVWGLMQSAQAYIQSSAYEGYGRSLVQAALARLPIITTDVGIVGEVFAGYHDVLSAPIADPAALAVHIRGLVDDHQARALLSIEAQKTAREHVESAGNISSRIAEDFAKVLG